MNDFPHLSPEQRKEIHDELASNIDKAVADMMLINKKALECVVEHFRWTPSESEMKQQWERMKEEDKRARALGESEKARIRSILFKDESR